MYNVIHVMCLLLSSGQKFPSKTLEISLQATVHFSDHYPPPSGRDNDDPFCVGVNAYADVSDSVCVCVCVCVRACVRACMCVCACV